MSKFSQIWATEMDHLRAARPVDPVLYFAPEALVRTQRRFRSGFPGR